MENQLPLMLLC